MSGSSNNYSPSFKNTKEVSCEVFSFKTKIASPNPDVLAKCVIGDELILVFNDSNAFLLYTNDEEYAGGIVSSYRDKLLSCINEGFVYKATILKIEGANCEIRILAK
ncbi:hypothetical protein [Olivibacter domesticus]|uniref:Uncharacterized protein n=1 Tax=Olivibacter domesticus TaxID=407022 RepID=A0A1H7GMU1_OLID1|nr:hypothetical protein [Olivibacter domesticus]SEK39448.1 hypothetical protein SAMN05661044_00137 [Olivibacter domesticus]